MVSGRRRWTTRLAEAIAPRGLGPSFRWLLASSWIGNLGDGISLAAGPLLVASETHDPLLVALAAVLQRLPWLLVGLLAGVLADRIDRRRLAVAAHITRTAIAASISIVILTGGVNIVFVLVALFALGTSEVVADTTAPTLLPMIVERQDLGLGNARLMAGIITVDQLAGPPIGAALFATGRAVPFLLEAVCMVAAAVAASRLVLSHHASIERRAVRHDIAEGVRWLWHHAAVRTLTITIVAFNVTFGAAWSVLVLYALRRLHAGNIGFGLLTTASAIGGLVGAAIYRSLTARVSLGWIMRIGLIIETLTHLSLALTRSTAIALVVMFVFGVHAQIWGVIATTIRQRAVPTRLQGRVSSVYLIGVQGGIVVGGAVGGVVAESFGITGPFWFAFVGSAILLAALWRQLPHVAHADDAEDESEHSTGPLNRPTEPVH
jgi:MFS family permease